MIDGLDAILTKMGVGKVRGVSMRSCHCERKRSDPGGREQTGLLRSLRSSQ